MAKNSKLMQLRRYQVRTCTTIHRCQVCGNLINWGEEYYDGGYSRRAHKPCVDDNIDITKITLGQALSFIKDFKNRKITNDDVVFHKKVVKEIKRRREENNGQNN